jgi:hypothetical protein
MANQESNPTDDITSAAPNEPGGKQLHPDFVFAADGFDIWWKKTFAQHTAMVAQASALMRTHRCVSLARDETRIGQAL